MLQAIVVDASGHDKYGAVRRVVSIGKRARLLARDRANRRGGIGGGALVRMVGGIDRLNEGAESIENARLFQELAGDDLALAFERRLADRRAAQSHADRLDRQ